MLSFRRISHNPVECRKALDGAGGPIYIDTETTGKTWADRIVSVGLLVDDEVYILFVRSNHRDVTPHQISLNAMRDALHPLTVRDDLTAVFHHAAFDVVKFLHDGIQLGCRIEDTFKLLKLVDPDRGWEPDDKEETGRSVGTVCRYDRRYREQLNYALKDTVKHILGLDAPHLPGAADRLDYDRHVDYLTSDLLITRELHQYVRGQLSPAESRYYGELAVPVTPLLANMSFVGCRANGEFITSEHQRLTELMEKISVAHLGRFGMRLDVSDYSLRQWIFGQLGCRPRWGHKRIKTASGQFVWSLERAELQTLRTNAEQPAARKSLGLLLDFKLAKSLATRLGALRSHIDRNGRIHSRLDDIQASGRITSRDPNLQQIAGKVGSGGKKEFVSDDFKNEVVRSRNAIVATPGYRLVAFDIAQADVRCLTHIVENFPQTADEYIGELRLQYESPAAYQYQTSMWDHFQPHNRKGRTDKPQFDPEKLCRLAHDFRRAKEDFYRTAAKRMLGRPLKPKSNERNHMKQTILGIVNGMSANGLADRLGVATEVASDYLAKFADAYPQVAAFTTMMQHAFAVSGTAVTFAGRPRRITPHWWMVTQPHVDLFVSYRNADKLWVRVVPLQANRHTLCCHVLRVIDAKNGSLRKDQEIYNDRRGRISSAYYRFFEDDDLVFRLPIRNVSWSIIRRVRTKTEEVRYEGFDRVRRQLFNHLCQGATVDVAKRMMIRSTPVCRTFGARLLLQIHDELVFEVPVNRAGRFIRRMRSVLEQPPTPDFRIPIVVEPKSGSRFGELRDVSDLRSKLPSQNLGHIVRRCISTGQHRRLQRLLPKLCGRRLTRRRFTQQGSAASQVRNIISQILSTYQSDSVHISITAYMHAHAKREAHVEKQRSQPHPAHA